ncbi:MAG: pilus assembly protein PilP [Pseudomonadota bacterium]
MKALVVLLILGLAACSSSESHQDLREFIDENIKRPPGQIKEPPRIEPYEAFSYDAYRLRSPFDRPVVIVSEQQIVVSNNNVKPDLTRQKERLEQYDLSSLSMVGTLTSNGQLWALISDPDGSIERVRRGNFLGKNHGRVIALSNNKIDIIEIVASGEGWLERPNALELKLVEQE